MSQNLDRDVDTHRHDDQAAQAYYGVRQDQAGAPLDTLLDGRVPDIGAIIGSIIQEAEALIIILASNRIIWSSYALGVGCARITK